MKKFKSSLFLLILLIIYFSLSTNVFGEEAKQEIEPPSLETLNTVELKNYSTDAISWSYDYTGKPSGLTGVSSPIITYYIKITGDASYELNMLIDGVKVDADYDEQSGYLTYQANNLTGTHKVSIELTVYGKKNPITSWNFTIDTSPVNPFEGKNLNILNAVQTESISRLNKYRNELQLPSFSENEILHKAAQAHSNYLSTNNVTGHNESSNKIGYTGNHPWERAAYFGFTGSAGEGITYQKKTGLLGVDNLMDAPYHRLSIIDPHSDLAGIGYNDRGDIVINYGSYTRTEKQAEVVLYPYDKQQNAKVSWFVAENPNPLRFWGVDKTYVGYPISYAYFPVNSNDQLLVKSLSLTNESGQKVPFYDVTPSRDDHSKNHVFLIPKSPLEVDHTYFVEVEASVKDAKGNVRDVSRSWSFKTADQLDIHDIYFSKYLQNNFINVHFNSGEEPTSTITIEKDGEVYIKYQDNRQWTYQPITEGDFTLTIESLLFNSKKTIPITITKNNEIRYNGDGDWNVLYSKENPGVIDTIPPVLQGIENVAINLNDRFDPKFNVSATDNVDGDITEGIVIEGTVDTTKVGTYELIYRVVDQSGNQTKKIRKITVKESNAPKMPIVNEISNMSTFVTGQAEAGTVITMKLGEDILGTTVVSTNGTFTIPIVSPKFGTQLYFISSDEYGNESEPSIITVMDEIGHEHFFTWQPEKSVPVDKNWTIAFNDVIDEKTINAETVYIQYNQQNVEGIKLRLGQDRKSLEVLAPEAGYEKGKTYFLYIEGKVKSTSGKFLNKPIKLKFFVN
ncbi:uncharacterized protein YkwD [Ureibacillus xyleni]|uniref:Uncharacterized protein YkwD n=1 Tax=Ureibacillus xyleni TaxID=614648 RepID=A0A285T7V0_9BACL|nr:immunoglobulin-like domain-containing protein [Ureibacillus xyleni]SOC15603.1 uncharacterized protein YkwD [Ureibacillus xyleni]